MNYIIVSFVSLLAGGVLATLYHTQIANAELKAEEKVKALLAPKPPAPPSP